MKLLLTIVISLCVGQSVAGAQAQQQSNPCPQPSGICDPRKFDEYGDYLSLADEKFRLDNVAVALKSDPDSLMYLFAYDGRRGCSGAAEGRAFRAKEYLVNKRGIESRRIVWTYGGHREDSTIEIWVVPSGAAAPSAAPTVDPGEARLRRCKPRLRKLRGKS